MIDLKHILLAENNPRDVELILEAMSENSMEHHVDVVSDGVEAIEYLRYEGKYADRKNGNPAFILLDINMPRRDGIETLRIIREDPKLKKIPIVILTSSREEQDLINSYNYGVNAYVVKPLSFIDFIGVVKQIGIFWTAINEMQMDEVV